MGKGLRNGQGGGMGVQTSRHLHRLISVPATFLNFFSRFFCTLKTTLLADFVRLPYTPSLFSTRSPNLCGKFHRGSYTETWKTESSYLNEPSLLYSLLWREYLFMTQIEKIGCQWQCVGLLVFQLNMAFFYFCMGAW